MNGSSDFSDTEFVLWDQFPPEIEIKLEIHSINHEDNIELFELFPCMEDLKSINVKRNEFDLQLIATMDFNNTDKSERYFTEHFGRIQPQIISCVTNLGSTIIDFYPVSKSQDYYDFVHGIHNLKIVIKIRSISVNSEADCVYKRYFLYNATKDLNKKFRKQTNISIQKKFEMFGKDRIISNTLCETSTCLRSDYFQISNHTVRLYQLSSEITNRLDNLVLEIEGSALCRDDLYCLIDFLSLIIGRHLILIGEKSYREYPIGFVSYSPGDYKFQIQSNIQIGIAKTKSFSDIAETYFPKFQNLYQTMDLRLALRYFHDAMTQYMEIGIVQYRQTVECLEKAYFKNRENQEYFTKEEMMNKYGDILLKLKERILDNGDPIAVYNSIENSFIHSDTKRINTFGKEIGVVLNNKEKDIVGRCNKIRHGETIPEDKLIEGYFFYRIYCYRLLFNLIGIKADYKTFWIMNLE